MKVDNPSTRSDQPLKPGVLPTLNRMTSPPDGDDAQTRLWFAGLPHEDQHNFARKTLEGLDRLTGLTPEQQDSLINQAVLNAGGKLSPPEEDLTFEQLAARRSASLPAPSEPPEDDLSFEELAARRSAAARPPLAPLPAPTPPRAPPPPTGLSRPPDASPTASDLQVRSRRRPQRTPPLPPPEPEPLAPPAEVHKGLRGWLEKKLGPIALGGGLGVAYAGGLIVFADKLNGLALPMAAVPAAVWGISKAVVAVQERRIQRATVKLQGTLPDEERARVEAKLERWKQPGILTRTAARVCSSTAVTSFAAVSLVAGVPAVRLAPQLKELFNNSWMAIAQKLNEIGFGTGGSNGGDNNGQPEQPAADRGGGRGGAPDMHRGPTDLTDGINRGHDQRLSPEDLAELNGTPGGAVAGGGAPEVAVAIPGTGLTAPESHNLLTSIPRTVTADAAASGNSVWAASVRFTQPISDALHLTPQQGQYLADVIKDVMAKYHPRLQPGDVIDFTPHLDEIIRYAQRAIPANIANPGRSPALESLTGEQLQDLMNRVVPVLQSLRPGS